MIPDDSLVDVRELNDWQARNEVVSEHWSNLRVRSELDVAILSAPSADQLTTSLDLVGRAVQFCSGPHGYGAQIVLAQIAVVVIRVTGSEHKLPDDSHNATQAVGACSIGLRDAQQSDEKPES